MNLLVNGEGYVLDTPSPSIQNLLEKLGIAEKRLAVEHNKQIVPRDTYNGVLLSEGDSVEIVHFIGGG